MFSIPGLPTPGSEVPVLIKRVNLNPVCGLVELWVNMNEEKQHIFEQMREEIQTPKCKFSGLEGKPQDPCLVCIGDTWHRALIVSIQSEKYNVFLIDLGQSHIATSKDLAWGQEDSFVLSPEIEMCILANILCLENKSPEKATKFLNSLLGKKFNGLVQHVVMSDRTILLDIPFVSKHMCKVGVAKKIPMGTFESHVLKYLHSIKEGASGLCHEMQEKHRNNCQLELDEHYLYPELLTDAFETVEVTEVMDPQNIFCRLLIFSKALKMISDQIHQHYEESPDFTEAQPQSFGAPCAAKDKNGRWHRSLLKQNIDINNDSIEILNVDHGNSELVPVADIKPLHKKFLKLPVFTYHCSLEGIKDDGRGWTVEQIKSLKSLLLNQTVVAKFGRHNIPQNVYYVTLYAENAAGTRSINDSFIEKEELCQLSRTEQKCIQNETVPSFCILPEEGQGTVIYKNTRSDEQPACQGTKKLLVNGAVNDVATWNKNTALKNCQEHPDPLCPNRRHLSYYPPNGQNALSEGELCIGSVVDVKISCIENIQKFWCQTANSDALGLLMQDMQNHYATAHPQPLVESVCVARHPDSRMWYRARIITSGLPLAATVRFIDYGQTQQIPLEELYPIDPAFLQLKAQAFQCSLYSLKCTTGIDLNDAAFSEFQTFIDSAASSNNCLKCIIKAVTSDEQSLPLNVVDIKVPHESACTLPNQKCTENEVIRQIDPFVPSVKYNYSTYNIEVGGREKVCVTASEGVDHIYCQLDRNCHVFDKMMESVAQIMSKPQRTDHPVGLNSACLARYTDDQWYRGQIVGISPKLQVHFVDFGDTLLLKESDICPFPPEVSLAKSIPVQAIPLELFDIPKNVPQEVNKWFSDHAIGHSFNVLVVAKGEKGKLIVELFDKSLNVNAKVREKIAKVQKQTSGLGQQMNKHLSTSLQKTSVPSGYKVHEHSISRRHDTAKESKVCKSLVMCTEVDVNKSRVSVPERRHRKTLNGSGQPMSVHARITDVPQRLIKQGVTANVFVSHFNSPCSFFVQLQKEEAEMRTLLAKLNKSQSAGQPPADFRDLQIGDLVKTLNENSWYRAVVKHKLEDGTVRVQFIDIGSEAVISYIKIYHIGKEFAAVPKFSISCTLAGGNINHETWDENAIYKKDTMENPKKTFVCNFIEEKENVWNVTLQDKQIVAAELYLQNIYSKMKQLPPPPCPEGNVSICAYKMPSISLNNTEDVYTSCIVGPSYFWCQCANGDDLGKVASLSQRAGQGLSNMTLPETVDIGSPCLALFAVDKQWYRAQVIHKTDDLLHVLFVDYGNESDIDIKNVKSMPPFLLDMAPQAFLCSLEGFDESKGSWDDDVYDEFYNLMVDKPLMVTVLNVGNNSDLSLPQYGVHVECDGMIVNTVLQKHWKPLLVDVTKVPQMPTSLKDVPTVPSFELPDGNGNSCMYKEPKISQNKTEEVFVSCIVGPHYFWCQYANTEEFNTLSRLVQTLGQASQEVLMPETVDTGSPCLALFSSDNQWYRAQVIQKTHNTLNVLFIDYGNESEVEIKHVKPLPFPLLEKAPQAFLCSLAGFDDSQGSWDDEVYDVFHNLMVDKPLKVTLCNREAHSETKIPQHVVKIECESMIVNVEMRKYWKPFAPVHEPIEGSQTETLLKDVPIESSLTHLKFPEENVSSCVYINPNIGQSKTEEVYASCIFGPCHFWCQYANTKELNEVTKLAQEIGQVEQDIPETLDPGSKCLALFSTDGQWYRAQVIHRTDRMLSVVFIDYGNESEVDIKDVRLMPQILMDKPPQAFFCSLGGFDESKGSWDDEIYDDFYNLLVDKPLKVTVVNMEANSESAVPQYAVKIECNNMVVNTLMQKYWKPFATDGGVTEHPESVKVDNGQEDLPSQ
ncbi:tudor domain-containing protein 6 [Thalassophryne amazonica]|uniref:tudor domain-containing protein 6 n=1 Tax=Thalassophryne amazonica TaxID=390379 RepID=UPI0014723C14|nr:tudor domain-containing protein 6 [Thalassophryne amazonica]